MEKMKFGTGGQPVALEDLELLQDNAQMLGLLVLESLTDGKAQQFLMRKVDAAYQALTGGRVKVTFGSGVLVVNGEFYPFAATELELSNLSAPVYVCIQRNELDNRRFENNETKACRVKYSATLSATPVGECHKLAELKTVVELLRELLNLGSTQSTATTSANVEVTFKNGYSGKVAISVVGSDLVLSVEAKSEQAEWSPNEKGVIFSLKDANLATRFNGVRSAGFPTQNNAYLSFLDYTASGALMLTLARQSILVVGYLPPTTPINTTFTIPN